MTAAERQFVFDRAGHRCEYCRLPEAFHDLPYQIEHVIAKKHNGGDGRDNLALSCYNCNAFKGPNIAGLGPNTEQLTRLFYPRRDHWDDHFYGSAMNSSARLMSGGRLLRFCGSITKTASRCAAC